MEIRIHLPRPLLLLTGVIFIALWASGVLNFSLPGETLKGDVGGQTEQETIVDARQTIDRESVKREVLERREEILRYQFLELDKSIDAASSDEEKTRLSAARVNLLDIIRQRQKSEELIAESLLALWEAEGTKFTLEKQNVSELLAWPVTPKYGISAFFLRDEDGYKDRFGIDHHAIDIPAEQGTDIFAPSAGTVERVALNGLGYSYITINHENGVQTIYGHISASFVQEGERVLRGQKVGAVGGEPGTEGAGLLTTGPHLHFAVRQDGVLVDPLQYLPKLQ